MDQRARDRHPLLLAAGELLGERGPPVAEPHLGEERRGPCSRAASRGRPFSSSGRRRFSSTVSVGIRLKNWKTKPT